MKIRVIVPIGFPAAAPRFFGVVGQFLIVTESAATRDSQTRIRHRHSLIAANHP